MGRPKKSIRVAGLDLAAVNSGMCVIEAGTRRAKPPIRYEVLAEHAIRTEQKSVVDRIEKSQFILNEVQKYKCDLVVIEDYAMRMGPNNTTALQHGEFGGMVKLRLHEAGEQFLIVPPTSMRSFADVPPKSKKEQLMTNAYEEFGFRSTASRKAERSNITDAFWHAVIGTFVYYSDSGVVTGNLKPHQKRMIYGDSKKVVGLLGRQMEK